MNVKTLISSMKICIEKNGECGGCAFDNEYSGCNNGDCVNAIFPEIIKALKQQQEIIKTMKIIEQNLNREIKKLEEEIQEDAKKYENLYEEIEADILSNMRDSGTSCDWCLEVERNRVIRKFAEKLKSIGKQEEAYDYVSLWDIDKVLKEMTARKEERK